MNEEDINNFDDIKEIEINSENTQEKVHSNQTSYEEKPVTVLEINENTNILDHDPGNTIAHDTGSSSIINEELNDDIPCRQIDYYDYRNRDVLDSLIYQRELDFESVGLNINSYSENHDLFELYTRIQTVFDQAISEKDKIIEDLNLKILDLEYQKRVCFNKIIGKIRVKSKIIINEKTELLRYNEGEFYNQIIKSKQNFDSQIEALKIRNHSKNLCRLRRGKNKANNERKGKQEKLSKDKIIKLENLLKESQDKQLNMEETIENLEAERKIKEFEETNDDNSDIELISSKDFKCPSKNCNGNGNIHPDKKAHYSFANCPKNPKNSKINQISKEFNKKIQELYGKIRDFETQNNSNIEEKDESEIDELREKYHRMKKKYKDVKEKLKIQAEEEMKNK
ncbi:unnamed protein product [Brachionus calyciflorus]|uniref:Uncharacterized protein n=1 Tax=Brachionus calyciflorus TaxID=104777 RepID=A0A814IKY0_9BILA|nr:unnamed protein product [Brachionus calyciflorus]